MGAVPGPVRVLHGEAVSESRAFCDLGGTRLVDGKRLPKVVMPAEKWQQLRARAYLGSLIASRIFVALVGKRVWR